MVAEITILSWQNLSDFIWILNPGTWSEQITTVLTGLIVIYNMNAISVFEQQ